MKGKRFFAMVLICLLAISCCGCKTDEEKAAKQAQANWNQASNEQRMSIYCALIKEYMLLVEDLGPETPYPSMKRSVKGSMMSSGLTQSEAIVQAEEYLTIEQAVFWRAEQDGITITDKEVKKYIQDNIISKVAQEEDYDVVSKACEKEGITFEDTIWAYEDSYKADLIGEKAGVKSYEEMERYKAEAVEQFKASDDYAACKVVLDNCARLIRDNITDKETLKAAEIYYE
ncbi:MAG: hypothetical protein IKI99_02370 [Firmicutes bacterium]|nr:hypothetical protein [Bacillota bacterium]